MRNDPTLLMYWHAYLRPAVVVVGAAVLGWLIERLFFVIVRRLGRRRFIAAVSKAVANRLHGPTAIILPLLAALIAVSALHLAPRVYEPVRHVIVLLLIGAGGWFAARVLHVIGDILSAHYAIDVRDNLRARKIRTQFHVLRRIGVVLISILAVGLMLVTFPNIRALGATLFASAGAAGIVVGLAARPMLSNLIAGFQIAMSEPIRLEDVVIVQGEYGWVEEITTTYVVVRVWDLRRLVLPLSYFIEQPFQNWTRKSSDLMGTVYLYADYTVPVDEVRTELQSIVKEIPQWDGKACSLLVTDAKERTLELRALVSASSAGNLWDLRCAVREKLVAFLQEKYPESLPRARLEIARDAQSPSAED